MDIRVAHEKHASTVYGYTRENKSHEFRHLLTGRRSQLQYLSIITRKLLTTNLFCSSPAMAIILQSSVLQIFKHKDCTKIEIENLINEALHQRRTKCSSQDYEFMTA